MSSCGTARLPSRGDRGVSTVEYSVLVAGLAGGLVVAVVMFGHNLSDTFSCMSNKLSRTSTSSVCHDSPSGSGGGAEDPTGGGGTGGGTGPTSDPGTTASTSSTTSSTSSTSSSTTTSTSTDTPSP